MQLSENGKTHTQVQQCTIFMYNQSGTMKFGFDFSVCFDVYPHIALETYSQTGSTYKYIDKNIKKNTQTFFLSPSTYFLYASSKAKNRTFLCSSLRNLSCCSSDWSKLERGNGNGNLVNDKQGDCEFMQSHVCIEEIGQIET